MRTVSRSIQRVPVMLESPQFPFCLGYLRVCQQKSAGQGRIKPAIGTPGNTCSTFSLPFFFFFRLVFLFSLALGLFFETIYILCARFGSAESFCFALDAQGRVVPILWLFLCGWQTGYSDRMQPARNIYWVVECVFYGEARRHQHAAHIKPK